MAGYDVKADVTKFKKDEEDRKKFSGSSVLYEIQDGENPLRLLPRSMKIFTPEGDFGFAVRYLVHYNMFEVQGFKMIVCPATIKEPCPICDMIDNEDDKGKIGRIRRQERFLYNVYDLRDEVMKLLETGPQIYDGFSKHWLDADWGPGRMIGIKEGCVAKIVKIPADKSSTGWNHYDVVMTPRGVDIDTKLPQGWQDVINALESKVPAMRPNQDLKRLVECYQKGIPPNKDEMQKREAVTEDRAKDLIDKAGKTAPAQTASQPQQAQPQQAQPQAQGDGLKTGPAGGSAKTGEIPQCFGVEFSPRKDTCKTCNYWVKCRESYTRG